MSAHPEFLLVPLYKPISCRNPTCRRAGRRTEPGGINRPSHRGLPLAACKGFPGPDKPTRSAQNSTTRTSEWRHLASPLPALLHKSRSDFTMDAQCITTVYFANLTANVCLIDSFAVLKRAFGPPRAISTNCSRGSRTTAFPGTVIRATVRSPRMVASAIIPSRRNRSGSGTRIQRRFAFRT